MACDNGNNSGGESVTYDPVVYTSYADGNTYELVITKSSSRATFTPGAGDTYVLTIKVTATGATVATSSGTVSSSSGGTLTLKNGDTEFTVTISDGAMTAITASGGGDIPGTTVAAPGAGMTAGGGNNNDGNKTPQLSAFESKFVGKWSQITLNGNPASADPIIYTFSEDRTIIQQWQGAYRWKGTWIAESPNKLTMTATHSNPDWSLVAKADDLPKLETPGIDEYEVEWVSDTSLILTLKTANGMPPFMSQVLEWARMQ